MVGQDVANGRFVDDDVVEVLRVGCCELEGDEGAAAVAKGMLCCD